MKNYLFSTRGFVHLIPIVLIVAVVVSLIAIKVGTDYKARIKPPQANGNFDASLQKFLELKAKVTDYEAKGASVSAVKERYDEILGLIHDKKFDTTQKLVASYSALLDANLQQKREVDKAASEAAKKKAEEETKRKAEEAAKRQAAQKTPAPATQAPAPAPAPVNNAPGSGYSRITVATERGNFTVDVTTADVSSTRVITDAGVTANCDDNCATMSLSDYVGRNGGYGGMNGTYFCPPDYSGCVGKTNTFHWFVFNAQSKTFINADKRHWSNAGSLFVFRSGALQFFQNPDSFGLDTNITGAIASHPTLLAGGQVVLTDSMMDDKQRTVKGNRGGIGNKGNTIYLLIAKSATVTDLAYIMKTLGIENGINLDGGGSSAMFYNGYKAGPGRSLPNAIILTR